MGFLFLLSRKKLSYMSPRSHNFGLKKEINELRFRTFLWYY